MPRPFFSPIHRVPRETFGKEPKARERTSCARGDRSGIFDLLDASVAPIRDQFRFSNSFEGELCELRHTAFSEVLIAEDALPP